VEAEDQEEEPSWIDEVLVLVQVQAAWASRDVERESSMPGNRGGG
jgi:hypothetical protein